MWNNGNSVIVSSYTILSLKVHIEVINKPRLTTLTNGFRVLTDSMNEVDSVAISVWINAGGRFEVKENCGIAHFLEHVAFKGTKNRSAFDIAKEFDKIGGQFNAYTSKEFTVYHAKVLKENFPTGLDIIADILLNPVFDSIEIERERKVVLQEIAQTNDNPDDILYDKYVETAYPNQALGRPILGRKELVNSFEDKHLQDFMAQHYHSRNMLLSVAGNIEHEQVVDFSKKSFANLPEKKNFANMKEAKYIGGEFREKRDLEQVHVYLGFNGLNYYSEDYYNIQVMSLILGGGMSSRLFQEIRERRGLSYSISSFSQNYKDSGMLNIYCATEYNKVETVLDIVIQEMKKMIDCVTQDELDRAKSQIKSSLLMGMESNSSRADITASSYMKYNRHISKQEILEKINETTVKTIQRLMESILFGRSSCTIASIGKIENVPQYYDILKKI